MRCNTTIYACVFMLCDFSVHPIKPIVVCAGRRLVFFDDVYDVSCSSSS